MSQYERVAGEGEMSHHSFVVCKIFLKNLETPMYHKKKAKEEANVAKTVTKCSLCS